MSGWILIWVLFAAIFPAGDMGNYILTNTKLRERRAQRRAGIVFVAIGLVMLSPVLWVLVPLLCHTHRVF